MDRPRARRRLRRAALAASAAALMALLAAILFVHTATFRRALERRIESTLGGLLDREVTVRLEQLRPLALRSGVGMLRIAGGEPAANPLLELRGGLVDARWADLLAGRAGISELTVETLRVDLDQLPPPAAPAVDGPSPSLPERLERVRIDRLELREGRVHFSDRTIPLDLVADGIRLQARRSGADDYGGTLRIEAASLTLAALGERSFEARTDILLDREGLQLSNVSLRGDGIAIDGEAAWTDPFRAQGRASFSVVTSAEAWPGLTLSGSPLRGKLTARGTASLDGPAYQIEADLGSPRLGWRGLELETVSAHLTGTGEEWSLSDLAFRSEGIRFEGQARSAAPPALAPFQASLRWASDAAGFRAPLLTAGRLRGSGTVEGTALHPDALRAAVSVDAERLRFEADPSRPLAARLEARMSGGIVTLERLTADGPGVSVRASGSGGFDRPAGFGFDLAADDPGPLARSVERILAAFHIGPFLPPATGALGGRVDLSGRLEGPSLTRLTGRDLRGHVDFDATSLTLPGSEGFPVSASGRIALAAGTAAARAITLTAPGLSLSASGRLGIDGAEEVAVSGAADDAGAAVGAAIDLTRAIGGADFSRWKPSGLTGPLTLEGSLDGPWSALDGSVALLSEGIGPSGAPPRSLEARAALRAGALAGTLRLAGGDSTLDADFRTGPTGERPLRGNAGFSAAERSPQWWADLFSAGIPVKGVVSARGRVELPEGIAHAEIDVRSGEISGVPFELTGFEAAGSAEGIAVSGAQLTALGGTATFEGDLEPAGGTELRLRGDGFDVAELLELAEVRVSAAGRIGFDTRLTGSPLDPRVEGDLRLAGLSLEGRPLPMLAGPVLYGSSSLSVELAGPSGAERLALSARTDQPLAWTLAASLPVDLDLRALGGLSVEGPPLLLRAAATADLTGEGAQVGSLSGRVSLAGVELTVGPDTLTTSGGPVLVFDEGVARCEPFDLTGRNVTLRAAGRLSLDPPRSIDATAAGNLALRHLRDLVPGLRLDGMMALDARLGGELASPSWSGTASVSNGRLDHPSLPVPLENVSAVLLLERETWRLAELSLKAGGGAVSGSGRFLAGGPETGTLRVDLAGRGVRLPLGPSFRTELDATLAITRAPSEPVTVSGRLDLSRGLYDRDIRIEEELLVRTREFVTGPEIGGGPADRVRLDLEIEAPRGISIRNNLASVETSVSVRVNGTAADPSVSGRAELLEGGKVFFRGVTYQVTRGSLDYVSDPPWNPLLDIAGQASVSRYDITLLVNGRLEDYQVELTSSPPLSQADIVSVLMTGRTRDELAGSGGGLSEAQAAVYLTDRLSEEVQSALSRSLGLDEVTINPTLVADETDPAARITLGKRLTGKTYATYSRAVGGVAEDVYELRYTPWERFALVGRRGEEGDLSADALYALRRYIGPRRVKTRPPDGTEGRRIRRISIEGARAIEEKRVRREIRSSPGDRFRTPLILSGVDDIRDLYLREGYPEAEVDALVSPEEGGVAVEIVIDEGRRVDVVISGTRRQRDLRRAVLAAWRRSVFRDEIADEVASIVTEKLQRRGFAGAAVSVGLRRRGEGHVELTVDIRPGPRVRVEEIRIDGAGGLDERRVRGQMLTQESGFLTPGRLDLPRLSEDREAIRGLYRGLGYLDAVVADPEITYPSEPGRAVVRIRIDEGRRYTLGAIRFEGNERIDRRTLREAIGLRKGLPYIDQETRQARSRLRGLYDSRGYPDAVIDVGLRIDRDPAVVEVTFEITEGPRRTVASVDIVGAGVTRPHIIRREIEIEPGDPLSSDALIRSRQNLYRTGLFRSVKVADEPGGDPEGRQVVFTVDEAANLRTDFGIGYSTDEGARTSVSVGHVNLFGRRLHGTVGARVSQTDWRTFLLLQQPRLFGTSLQGLTSTFIEKEDRESFEVRRLGSTVQIGGKLRETNNWFTSYGLQEIEIVEGAIAEKSARAVESEIEEIADPFTGTTLRLGQLSAGVTRDLRDGFAWPTRGSLLQARISVSDDALLSDEQGEFTRALGRWTHHRRLGRRAVWNGAVRLGLSRPHGAARFVPLSERFFAGGDSSMRGFSRDAIEPLGFPEEQLRAAGVRIEGPLGGEALFILNQEVVFPLYEPLFGAVFYDAGNVYWKNSDLDFSDLRHAAGIGLRFRTPLGPVRLEHAWKLDREKGESPGRLHFSIGFPF